MSLSRLSARVVEIKLQTLIVALLCSLPVAAAACSQQPTAPSPPTQLAEASSTAAGVQVAAASSAAVSPTRFGDRTPGVVFVTSQGLYYDTFVVKDPLPMEGRFQPLVNGTTGFGPGQAGYLGGRWWEDSNGNGVQDASDHYFLCPLLPPGRPTP